MMSHMANAAKLFAHAPEGFDPHRAPEIKLTGPNAEKLKAVLLANARKAEEQWAKEHKFRIIWLFYSINLIRGTKGSGWRGIGFFAACGRC